MREKCFACGKTMLLQGVTVYCVDDQSPYVGPCCFAKIKAAGPEGFQPLKGGPRLYIKKPIHRPEEWTNVDGIKQLTCICGKPDPNHLEARQ